MELQEFGAELRQMRKDMHMTQEKLAEALGIDEKQLSKYENGKVEMKALIYSKLLKLHAAMMVKEEDEILSKIRQLNPAQKAAVKQLLVAFSE